MSFTRQIEIFVLVCAITFIMKYFFGHIEALTEIYNLVGNIGGQIKPLYTKLFLPITGKREFNKFNDFPSGSTLLIPNEGNFSSYSTI